MVDNNNVLASRDVKLVNLENLTTIIKDIAKCQANELQGAERSRGILKSWDFHLHLEKLTTLLPGFFKDLDEASVEEELKTIEKNVGELVSDGVTVKNHGTGQSVPIPYEVLTLLFIHTNENFRLQNFHELLDLHYNELKEHLKENLVTIYPERLQFDLEVKTLLPAVKVELLQESCKNGFSKKLEHLIEVGNNLRNYFKCPRLNQEDIYDVVKNKLDSADFTLLNYELIPLDETNGHLGEYFQLKVEIRQNDNDTFVDLFTKFLTPKAAHFKEILKLGPSMKEDWFYFGYLPKLRDVGLSALLDFAPNCYFSRINDVLIMDDMSKLGYVALTPNIKLEYSALRLGVRKLAKFHAGSIILEEVLSKNLKKDVRLGDLYEKYLKEVVFNRDSTAMKGLREELEKVILYLLSNFPDIKGIYSDEELIEKLDKCYDMLFEKLKTSVKYRNVIGHGDVYVSNMLFKFDEFGECEDVKLIDFQILRYCPPTQDVLFFLFQNSVKETLDLHFIDLINEYYASLSAYLQKNNVDINDVYPRDVFDESVEYMKSQAIIHALTYSRMTMLDPKIREKVFMNDQELVKMKKDPMYLVKKGLEDDNYSRVMKGLVQYFVDLVV